MGLLQNKIFQGQLTASYYLTPPRLEKISLAIIHSRKYGKKLLILCDFQVLKTCLQNLKSSGFRYLRDLFKKKRNCATHVLVTMLSDEKRSSKSYAMPVRYVTYKSIKDQFVRDINRELKEEMVRVGLTLAGT